MELSYLDAVNILLKKYGGSIEDYFKEQSYNRFLNGETKSISKGKISRTNEGLYFHHIDENRYLNLSNLGFIKVQKPPFSVQQKDRLVYCDLIEHIILHTLITKETKKKVLLQSLILSTF